MPETEAGWRPTAREYALAHTNSFDAVREFLATELVRALDRIEELEAQQREESGWQPDGSSSERS